MQYAQPSTNPAPPASLVGDGIRVIERLSEIHGRIAKLGDMLHGPQPRDTGASGPSLSEPSANVRRNLDRQHVLLSDIEEDLARIEARL